jgi:23S rRNA (uracil1939-C5)-methyltransferase
MPFTAPGDRVTGKITREKKNWAEAELTELNEGSPLRTKPLCPLWGKCGGCSLQHLSYEAQLEAKKTMLLDTLKHIGGFNGPEAGGLPELKVTGSRPWEYRNRVSFHTIRANRGPRAGFKARKSSGIVPVGDCPVCDPAIRSLLKTESLVPPPNSDRFTIFARDPVILGNGVSRGEIKLLDRTITVEAERFFQSNTELLEQCAGELRSAAAQAVQRAEPGGPSGRQAGEGPLMADLYAGIGTFSILLGDLFSGIDLVEENPAALELARHNLRSYRSRFFPQTAEKWARRAQGGYAFILVDPPRQGLSPSLAAWLVSKGAPVLACLSCEPSSFARDCRLLREAYTMETLHLYDFYPQTAHIESLAVFKRKENAP